MSTKDKIAGRVKQAAGDLANDPALRREGLLQERKADAEEELAAAREHADRKADEVAALERDT